MDIVRIALYIRVSTDEQVHEGYSLEAQRKHLLEYAKKNNYSVVDVYTDEGITARKSYKKHKEFMRLISDVDAGKVDLILFIKLDRWFRSVADYHKVQEILEANNVGWRATTEQYDTTTAGGRLYVNIRLAVAQDEADLTSERIKFVFDRKVAENEIISGKIPLGYKVEDKKLVVDEEGAEIVRFAFDTYLALRNELIEIDDYKKEYDSLHSELKKIESRLEKKEKDFSQLEAFLQSDFRDMYSSLDNEGKRALWGTIIEKIIQNEAGGYDIFFK